MEDDKKIFRPNMGMVILSCLIRAAVIGSVLIILYDLADTLLRGIPLILFRTTARAVCMTIGALVSVIISVFRFTTVEVSETEVVVKQLFKKRVFGLYRYIFIEKTEYKNYNGTFKALAGTKKFLIAKDGDDENTVRIRLYDFSVNRLYSVADEIDKIETLSLDSEIKEDIIRESWENELRFDMSPKEIISFEWKSIRLKALIYIGAAVFFTIVIIFAEGSVGISAETRSLAILFVLILCIMWLPFEIARTLKNAKRCPEFIEYKGDHLIVGERHFIISDIEEIRLTSADRKSNSLNMVQRYMKIKTDTGKYKFWLGSEGSMKLNTYKSLCDFVWHAFVSCPSKLRFK